MSNEKSRQQAVDQMNANQALEGLRPDAADVAIQRRYVEGTASIENLLRHASDFASENSGSSVGDYITSKEFADRAGKAVRDAISQTESLGLPCAYDPSPEMPVEPEILRIPNVTSRKM
jgi:hypothetical protein